MIAANRTDVTDLIAPGTQTFEKVVRYAIQRGHLQRTDADDIAQETALRTLVYFQKHPERFQGEKTVFQIAKHCIANEHRRRNRKRTAMTSFCGLTEIEQPDSRHAMNAPAREDWERALMGFKTSTQEIIRRFLIDGEPMAAIAERMQLTTKAVASRLDRARRKRTRRQQGRASGQP